MSSDAIIMVKSIGLSRTNGHKPCTLRDAVRHNRRLIQAEMGSIDRINPRESHNNLILMGPPSIEQVMTDAKNLLLQAGVDVSKLRRDHVQALEFIFSLGPTDDASDRTDYWQRCVNWLTKTCKLHVLSADLHRDEPHEHLHCLIAPVKQGKFLGAKLVQASAFSKLRTSFWECVAGPAGLRPPSPKLRGYTKVAAARLVIDRLRSLDDPVCRSLLWPLSQKDIRHDPLPYLQLLDLHADEVREYLVAMPLRSQQRGCGCGDASGQQG